MTSTWSPSFFLAMAALKIVPGQSGYMNLTSTERDTIQHVERFGASLSLVGVSFIFWAYWMFKRVRTVPNTFILFASIANVGASIACLIGYAGIVAGDDSGLCKVQAFLLEMFMQSDPWWSLAMAVNVYMVFFMAYNPNNFHRHLWMYCVVCFGVPAVPAVVMLFHRPGDVHMYGNATLWCWIADAYNQLRIFLYYLPIWTCIALSALIYVAVGYHVFHQRNQLRNLTLSNQAKDASGTDLRGSAEKEPQLDDRRGACYGTVTTEVQVTAEAAECSSHASTLTDGTHDQQHEATPPSTPTGASSITPVLPPAHRHAMATAPQPPAATLHPWVSPAESLDSDDFGRSPTSHSCSRTQHSNPFQTISSVSSAPRCRSASVANVNRQNWLKTRFNHVGQAWKKFRYKLVNLDPIKLAYLRTSFVFAISVLVTWTPSSINRVYALMYPATTSYSLNLASAVVLPLQGLWNAVIFAATSWAVLAEEFKTLWIRSGVRIPGRWQEEQQEGGAVVDREGVEGFKMAWHQNGRGRVSHEEGDDGDDVLVPPERVFRERHGSVAGGFDGGGGSRRPSEYGSRRPSEYLVPPLGGPGSPRAGQGQVRVIRGGSL
uniref:G-protein coupled receptor n=1 Tax=Podospora anserina (strain S / ATCC MYA-4624 / DSM 980 / FGSC 10383) TaxID=515849 RepID=A0A090D3U3_PODAN|nr:Putative G-protein coupled receptor [Podospora anserina S mat+]